MQKESKSDKSIKNNIDCGLNYTKEELIQLSDNSFQEIINFDKSNQMIIEELK